jgi:hypothetical protein
LLKDLVNYRKKYFFHIFSSIDGIPVLPVISKIVETIIKARIQNQVLEIQSRTQRGFTSGSSPVNSALPVEECYREVADNDTDCQIILLDAKSTFDKVIHSHMLRRVYQAGCLKSC